MNGHDNDRYHLLGALLLSLLLLVSFSGAIEMLFLKAHELNQAQVSILSGLASTLGAGFMLMCNYWFTRRQRNPTDGAAPNGNGNGDGGSPSPPPTPAPPAPH